ncbi:AAA family ATPase [Undibacterium sp. TC9W]|uniref:AAA family ATPase n=1 Tax=Undibacterium sp. TC9W TaxID=3413053 RepID=UPI003BF16D7D
MKLISLQIFSKGINGWGSDEFHFGAEVTQLFGPNGCGKTPLIQSVVFCLGFPSIFRDEIYHRCNHVTMKLELHGGKYNISRIFSRDTDITVIDPSGVHQRFYNERDYSDYLFELFNIRTGNLVTTSSKLGAAYMASLLPIYYLDQDAGYSDFYVPPDRFIKDQFSEMMRMAFGLPIKNFFDEKKDKILAKEALDFVDKLVNERSRELSLAKAESGLSEEEVESTERELSILESQLQSYKNSDIKKDDANDAIQRLVNANFRKIYDIDAELKETDFRIRSKTKIIDEINIEINTLSLNEDARRVFLSFEEICKSPSCALFATTSESYGKNLLYLRDQIKDLERNSQIESNRKALLKARRNDLLQQNFDLEKAQAESNKGSDASSIVETISTLKNQIFALQIKLADRKKIAALEKRYFDTIVKRDAALDKYESFSNDKSSNPSLIKIRSDLRAAFIRWLTILGTKNISLDITYKDDFTPVLGPETVGQLKGSTKVRVVLAYHAAVLELLASRSESVLKILVLDTPKQHEIASDDLNRYMLALKEISKKSGIQIIFSTTEYHYKVQDQDEEWVPSEPGEEQNMFFRVGN